MFAFLQSRSLLIFSVTLTISVIKASLFNVTVDDALPDPLTGRRIAYLPAGFWSSESNCTICQATPDPGRVNGGTWHDNSYFPNSTTGPSNIMFTFNGTAIYTFCVMALSTDKPDGFSSLNFYIDGERAGHFQNVPPGTQSYLYNVPVYSNSSLSPGLHEFTLENGQPGGGGSASLVLFDYLVYSYDNGQEATNTPKLSKKSNRIGITVGAPIGTIGVISVIALIVWLLRRRRKESSTTSKPHGLWQLLLNLGTPFRKAEPYPFVIRNTTLSHSNERGTPDRMQEDGMPRKNVQEQVPLSSTNIERPPSHLMLSVIPEQELVLGRIMLGNGNRQEGSHPPAYDQVPY